jgi:hypothetical protein
VHNRLSTIFTRSRPEATYPSSHTFVKRSFCKHDTTDLCKSCRELQFSNFKPAASGRFRTLLSIYASNEICSQSLIATMAGVRTRRIVSGGLRGTRNCDPRQSDLHVNDVKLRAGPVRKALLKNDPKYLPVNAVRKDSQRKAR